MGIFRFFLAASVVVAHSSNIPGLNFLEAGIAVKTFFIISGFYMQLILDSKYGRVANGVRLFYTNRALRIYPMYLITLALAVVFYLAASVKLGHPADRLHYWVEAWNLHYYKELVVIVLSQFTVLGLDVTPLFSFSPTQGFQLLNHSIPADGVLAWRFNFLPHCWSIGAELLFYMVVPIFNFCRTWVLMILCVLAATSCVLIGVVGPNLAGAMTYHFGPLQFFYFLMGILGYRMLYKAILVRKKRMDWRLFVPVVLVAGISISPWWHDSTMSALEHRWLDGIYLCLVATTVPILFHISKVAAWDRWIGELSYPMYLLHIPMKWVLLAKAGVSQKDEAIVSGLSLLILTVIAALAMTYFVDRPIEAFRRRRFEKGSEKLTT